MSKNIAIIQNALPFMTEQYIKTTFLKDNYSSVTSEIILKNELPYKIFLTFQNENQCDSFISQYNQKFYDDNIDYKLIIEHYDNNKKPSDIQNEIKKEEEKKVPYIFDFPYEDEWRIDYVAQPGKSGLLYKNEEAKKKIYKTVKYLVSKFGKNLMQGKSILNVSFPVFIFDKRTLHQAFCHEHRLAPYALSRAAVTKNTLEKLKWVTVHLMSFIHMTTTQIKPFNPLLGETFQCRIGNLKIYLEHTANHPITANFYGIDDDKTYEMFGYQITDANVNVNTVSATRLGYYFIRFFNDNSFYRIRIPDCVVKGLTMGDRLLNYEGKALVLDINNKLCSFIELNPGQKKGFLKGLFSKKKTEFPDFFQGEIVNTNYVTVDEKSSNHVLSNGYQSLCHISGEWTNCICFDDIEYWNQNDDKYLTMFHDENLLMPSDGSLRTDLLCFQKGKEDVSQKEKERLEGRQREDRKLRSNYAAKKK